MAESKQTTTDTPAFFQQVSDLMNERDCELNMVCSRAEGGKINLTVFGKHVKSDDDGEQAFAPIVLTARPQELDDPDRGLGAYVEEMNENRKTLDELRAQADEAQEKAEEAEKRRKEKAEATRKENTENGPLFDEDED